MSDDKATEQTDEHPERHPHYLKRLDPRIFHPSGGHDGETTLTFITHRNRKPRPPEGDEQDE